MKNTALDTPVLGRNYWVISDPENYLVGWPVTLVSLEFCKYLGDNNWLCDPRTDYSFNITSSLYMEVPNV